MGTYFGSLLLIRLKKLDFYFAMNLTFFFWTLDLICLSLGTCYSVKDLIFCPYDLIRLFLESDSFVYVLILLSIGSSSSLTWIWFSVSRILFFWNYDLIHRSRIWYFYLVSDAIKDLILCFLRSVPFFF